jgi:hypothetical protein
MDLLQHPWDVRTATVERGAATASPMAIGAEVELRSRFDDRWTHGFAIAVQGDAAYQLRRLSDGHVLPAWFPAQMLRPRRS